MFFSGQLAQQDPLVESEASHAAAQRPEFLVGALTL
jgi:hypothetical protein